MQKNRGSLNLQRIIRKCADLNKNWLLDGEGEMRKKAMGSNPNRIPVYSSLNIEDQVPDFHRSIKAGNIYADVTEELLEFTASDQIIGYIVSEHSLAPTLRKGDIAIISLDNSIEGDDIYLVSEDHEVSFCRLPQKTVDKVLESENGVQEPQNQSFLNGSKIIGNLVWVMRRV